MHERLIRDPAWLLTVYLTSAAEVIEERVVVLDKDATAATTSRTLQHGPATQHTAINIYRTVACRVTSCNFEGSESIFIHGP